MEADIVMTIAMATAVVLIISQFTRVMRAMMLHRTVREALTRESALTPELLEKIDEQKPAGGGGDDRIGLVLLAIGLAILGYGVITGDAEDIRNLAGISLFPLFVGAALFGRQWLTRRSRAEA
jgi:hypothetical protein